MFKKLRNKFLIINMSITSTVMIVAFLIIYLITYNNIRVENQKKLSSVSTSVITMPALQGEEGGVVTHKVSSDYSLSFYLIVDSEGEVLNETSFIDMSPELYKKAANMVWSSKKNSGSINLEGKKWQYEVAKHITNQIISENGQQYTLNQETYQINFLDVTDSKNNLIKLLTTLIIVGLFMVFAIYVISLYFANKAIKPISEAFQKQKQFVADASHELKTPLSIINANYDVLLSYQDETIKSQLKWFEYIKVGTDRMTKLINDMLSLAKLENFNMEINKIPFNVSNKLDEIIKQGEASITNKGVKLTSLIEPNIIIKSDEEKVKQVIFILFENAVKYVNENGQINVELKKLKQHVKFSICNSGKGIDDKSLLKIFDRFYRVDSSRKNENGSFGLGLSIAKTTVDGLEGHIKAESNENGYTIFTIILPLN